MLSAASVTLFFAFAISNRSFPGTFAAKPILLVGLLLLAGCGGATGGSGSSWQSVAGSGFRFSAPAAWAVARRPGPVVVSQGKVNRVQVQTFRLVKAYRPSLFEATSRELDRVATQVADELGGRVGARRTVRVDGREARSYRI